MSAALLILGLATFTGFDDDAIFEAPVAAQPFDKEPFRPVKIPHWVRGTLGVGYTLSGMDESARKRAVAHGVSISEMGFVDPFYAYYDSKLLKRRSPHVPLPRIREEIASYRRLGLRILGVYPPCLQSEVYESHPEWRRVAEDVRTIPTVDLKQHPYGGMLCLLGPYGDFFVEVLAEIAAMHPDVTAFSFDGLHYGGVCYCEHCRASFRKEAGREIPKANLDDPAFRRYQHWADRRMEDVVRRAQRRLKKLNPDLALVTWTTNAGRFGHFLSVPRNMPARMNLLLDAPDQELWLDETNRGATIVPAFGTAYAWSVTDHRVAFSEPYLMSHGNPYGKDSFPAHEVLRRMLLSVTYGNGASIAVAQPKRLQEPVYRCLDEVKRRGPWLVHKEPERWAALLMSDNAKNFYARSAGRVEDRYLSAPLGAFRACVEEHLPVTLINDWNLTDAGLAPYSVLILPNAASVDERQAKAIAAFVRSGGGVVASLDASLFDEYGDPRSNFALADLLGVDFKGPLGAAAPKEALDVNFAKAIGPDYWEKRTNAFDVRFPPNSPLASTKLRELVGDEPVTFKGPAVRITARPGTDVAATIRAKDGTGPEFPAATRRREGKGTAIYFAAGLDHGYYAYAYPYQRAALAQAIRSAARIPPPVEVTAPMCVHATVMRQRKDGERLLVHLFNDVNTAGGHALPNDDVPLREETIPIVDIEVRFADGAAIGAVRQQPANLELRVRRENGAAIVRVPRLEVHSIVVAEIAPETRAVRK